MVLMLPSYGEIGVVIDATAQFRLAVPEVGDVFIAVDGKPEVCWDETDLFQWIIVGVA